MELWEKKEQSKTKSTNYNNFVAENNKTNEKKNMYNMYKEFFLFISINIPVCYPPKGDSQEQICMHTSIYTPIT